MSNKAGVIYSRQNQVIHRALRDLNMPYKDHKTELCALYSDIAGRDVSGLSDLSLGERDMLIRHYQEKGLKLFKPFVGSHLKGWRKGDPDITSHSSRRPMAVPGDKKRLIGKIAAMLADMDLSWKYADGISNRMFGIRFVEWCSANQLHKIVVALVIKQRRYRA